MKLDNFSKVCNFILRPFLMVNPRRGLSRSTMRQEIRGLTYRNPDKEIEQQVMENSMAL